MRFWRKAGVIALLVIVDSGPLLASANRSDPDHTACVDFLTRSDVEMVIPALCIAEVCYFLGQRHGADVEARFASGLANFRVQAPEPEDWPEIASLMRTYGDLPIGATDASVAVLADRLKTTRIATLDRRHFSVVRNRHGSAFELYP